MMILTLIIVLGLVCSCTTNLDPTPIESNNRLTEVDSGRSIELKRGDQLEITLPGNPTTGFQWEVSSDSNALLRLSGEPESQPLTDALGSESKMTLRFDTIAIGQTHLTLIYHRPFEKDVPPIKIFNLIVTIR